VKGGFIAAWLVGEAIVIWRMVHRDHRPPVPGALLGVTALFLGLGALAEYQPAAGLATAVAWGLDVAALANVLPEGLGGQITRAQETSAQAEGLTTGPGPAPVAV
jgi:hypothetical protein